MKCQACQSACSCVDSRPALAYGGGTNLLDQEPVRERKYICRACGMAFITQEYVALQYRNGSRRPGLAAARGKTAAKAREDR